MQLTAGAYPNAGYCHSTTAARRGVTYRLIIPLSASATYANVHRPFASLTHQLSAPPWRSNSLWAPHLVGFTLDLV